MAGPCESDAFYIADLTIGGLTVNVSLQDAYDDSPAGIPEIVLDTTRNAVNIAGDAAGLVDPLFVVSDNTVTNNYLRVAQDNVSGNSASIVGTPTNSLAFGSGTIVDANSSTIFGANVNTNTQPGATVFTDSNNYPITVPFNDIFIMQKSTANIFAQGPNLPLDNAAVAPTNPHWLLGWGISNTIAPAATATVAIYPSLAGIFNRSYAASLNLYGYVPASSPLLHTQLKLQFLLFWDTVPQVQGLASTQRGNIAGVTFAITYVAPFFQVDVTNGSVNPIYFIGYSNGMVPTIF